MAACLLNRCRRNLSHMKTKLLNKRNFQFSVFFVSCAQQSFICWSHKTFLFKEASIPLWGPKPESWHHLKSVFLCSKLFLMSTQFISCYPWRRHCIKSFCQDAWKSTMLLTNRNWVLNWKTRCFLLREVSMSFCCLTF
jgi:hypothetical protein